MLFPSRCPPVITTSQYLPIFQAALIASSLFLIGIPDNISASGMLGVTRIDFFKRYFFRESAKPCRDSLPPDPATITGSTTILSWYSFTFLATERIISGE